jgi:hypothetical protein
MTSTATSSMASSARQLGIVKFGGFHSEKYWPRELTRSTAGSSFAPTGVSRPATRPATTGTAASVAARRPRTVPSRTSPATATREMITPSGHMPWHMAHTHVSGTSHQAEREEPCRIASHSPAVRAVAM